MIYCTCLFCRQQEEYLRRTIDYSEDSTQPASANSSVCEGPTSPLIVDNTLNSMEAEAKHSQEVESLKRLLQEVKIKYFLVIIHLPKTNLIQIIFINAAAQSGK